MRAAPPIKAVHVTMETRTAPKELLDDLYKVKLPEP